MTKATGEPDASSKRISSSPPAAVTANRVNAGEIARLLGWYRIPLRTAPKVVAVDYLAFYQPSAFGERGGQIELAEPLYDKARVLGQQNNDPNTAIYKANFERVHAKLKDSQSTKKQQ